MVSLYSTNSTFFIATHTAFVVVDATSSISITIHTNVSSPIVTVKTNGLDVFAEWKGQTSHILFRNINKQDKAGEVSIDLKVRRVPATTFAV